MEIRKLVMVNPEQTKVKPNPCTKSVVPRVALIQDGARLHYALAVALKRAGMLSALFTNWYNDGSQSAKIIIAVARMFRPGEARRMEERNCPELAGINIFDSKFCDMAAWIIVNTFGWQNPLLRLIWRYQAKRSTTRGPLASEKSGERVLFAFSHCASKKMIHICHDRGIPVILDQPIAPPTEMLLQAQINQKMWSGWGSSENSKGHAEWISVERDKLLLADHVTCASTYVCETMVADGVPKEKISVIPYPLDLSQFPLADRKNHGNPVVVGFCGQVGLRKGAPWFLEVAKICHQKMGDNICFVMVGKTAVTLSALEQLRKYVKIVGAVPRSQIIEQLNKFDIFLFPSTCEGSAGAVMEAMATGLPIVTTPNSGTVVRDGMDGFIAPYDQPDILAAHVLELAIDPKKRLAMGSAAAERAREFSIDFYSREITKVIYRVLGQHP